MNGTPRTAAEEADHGLSHRRQRPPLPGRPRRRRLEGRVRKRRSHCLQRCFAGWWNDLMTQFSSLALAVCLWYSLGIVSIGSSKLLLSTQQLPPLCLTFQQFVIGSTFVRILLKSRCLSSPGLQPWPTGLLRKPAYYYGESDVHTSRPRSLFLPKGDYQFLTLAGVYFCGGFLATNYGFSGSSAAFVETIKAAEPITSATVAVLWGIESLNQFEIISLVTIVVGVLLSTLGNRPSDTETAASLADSARACLIVMASNLCFSFRGLYQKLFRATSDGGTAVVDDLNLQFRMQQLGSYLLFVPVVVFHGPSLCQRLLAGISLSNLFHYMILSLVNGCAFASYNLASTFILSRISVVHHAALNCIRRIFAIIVVSLLFQIPITWMGATGIGLSFLGFMSFTHFKVQKQKQPPHTSPLLPVNTSAG
ncbi:hypothetical protein FisN_13Lh190 [Fistulifera solaris]|uniref:Sugar phosphate transporter domain-containing protein n=1 Tax=Fistulifera solaris TaxID=1519565 RepID=A0A1Z5KMK3_FISSO|nr:hypothetical protein FisN_13Lh190 [Fistulifera solaris]|eukprot:GAX27251.1 hypothetical protein FisN_13Lh190 [Fistulifera solaris]